MSRATTNTLVVAVGCGLAVLIAIHESSPTGTRETGAKDALRDDARSPEHHAVTVAPESLPPVPDRIAVPKAASHARPPTVVASASTRRAAKKVNPQPPPVENAVEPLVPHELAREALSDVGFDGEAEMIWAQAINDPALSEDQRRNLIEDLNEDGFADPKNITLDDVPLIQNRLQLIERLAPEAMDQINADAFNEAYKDLTNMLKRLGRS